MSKKKVESMQRKVRNLQRQLSELGFLMRGSVVRIGTKNKQYYFSLNKDKKTRLIFLGDKKVDCARKYSNNHKKLLRIVEEMTILNMEILKRNEDRPSLPSTGDVQSGPRTFDCRVCNDDSPYDRGNRGNIGDLL